MKFTSCLSGHGHNLYRIMRNQWKVARKRRVLETKIEEILGENKLEVVEANSFVTPIKPAFDFSSIVGLVPQPVPKNENHPLYKTDICYMYKDNSVLLEGLHQAMALTNTVQLKSDTLPPVFMENLIGVQLPDQDELVKRCIKTSCLYDAEQKKLPVRKDPTRPAWNFPRDYGISESRKNRMLCSRMVQLCSLANPEISARRALLQNVFLSAPLKWENENVQFELCADMFLCSDSPLSPIVSPTELEGHSVSELNISHPLISLQEESFYELRDIYPLKESTRFSNVHTVIAHYNNSEVKNIFDTPVTMQQILGRSLLKAFTAAVTQARHNYGLAVKDLPKPVIVQCIQTDGKSFHFSVLQLNSADISSSRCNVFWSLPPIDLYEDCSYFQGVPTLHGYNPEVMKLLNAFYVNNS